MFNLKSKTNVRICIYSTQPSYTQHFLMKSHHNQIKPSLMMQQAEKGRREVKEDTIGDSHAVEALG